MKTRLSATATLLTLVALSFFSLAADSETGLEGVISISPAHGGPAMIGGPNSTALADTAFIVTKGANTIASFTTDNQGRFRILLPEGHYTIALKAGRGAIGRRSLEVDVIAGKMKQVEWTYDSGMR